MIDALDMAGSMLLETLHASQLNYVYQNKVVLHQLNFQLKRGQVLLVKGANGSGKSTLLKLLAGLIPIQTGDIRFNNLNYTAYYSKFKAQLGYSGIPYPIVSQIKTLEYLDYISKLRNGVPFKSLDWGKLLVKQLNLSSILDQAVNKLSTGAIQQLSTAQALIHQPSLVILDEPNANLDQTQTNKLVELCQILKPKMALIICSHQTMAWETIVDQELTL